MSVEKSEPSRTDFSSSSDSIVHENIILAEDASVASDKKVELVDPESLIDSTTPPAVGPPPNGGLMAWLQVLAGFFLFFNSWGIVNTFGVFQTYYRSDLLTSSSPSSISWIGSIQGFMVINFSVILGPLVDRGHAKAIVFVGCFILAFGMMMTSLGHEYYQILLSQGFAMGIGCSCAFVSSVAVISSYFSTRRAFAMGVCASGSSLGGTIYPIMAHRLIPIIGFPWTIRAMGFMIFATTIMASFLLKPRLPPSKRIAIVHLPSLRDPILMVFSCATLFGFAGMYVPIFYVQAYAISQGVDSNLAFYLVSILNAGSTFGRIIPNFLADKIGPYNIILWCATCCTILIFSCEPHHLAIGAFDLRHLWFLLRRLCCSIPPACVARITRIFPLLAPAWDFPFSSAALAFLLVPLWPVLSWKSPPPKISTWVYNSFSGAMMTISLCFCLTAKLLVGKGKFFVKS